MKLPLYLIIAVTLAFVVSGPIASVAHAQATNTATPATPASLQKSSFVPLTNLPGISNIIPTGAPSQTAFIAFFNSLYKICIGAAALIALLQIIRAGVTWMAAGDSTEQVSNARHLISNAVLGLVLVLSPVIVFSIINPNVLSLTLNVTPFVTSLSTPGGNAVTGTPQPTATPNPSLIQSTGQPNPACTASHPNGFANGAVLSTAPGSIDAECCAGQTAKGCSVDWNYAVSPAYEFCSCSS